MVARELDYVGDVICMTVVLLVCLKKKTGDIKRFLLYPVSVNFSIFLI